MMEITVLIEYTEWNGFGYHTYQSIQQFPSYEKLEETIDKYMEDCEDVGYTVLDVDEEAV